MRLWYIKLTIDQHIENNSNRYKDFIGGNIEDYLSKMLRNGIWDVNLEIRAFSEIYSVNVNIHELESTLEPSYKFINVGDQIIQSHLCIEITIITTR